MAMLEIQPKVFSGTAISPLELLDLAEFATPDGELSDETLVREADNLAEWCDDNPSLARHALLLAQGRSSRAEVIAVLAELAQRDDPARRLAASA
ncbi:MAG: hypothetical protein ABW211_02835 [Acidimicrobiia bacterium]